jgi:hypothetical protein
MAAREARRSQRVLPAIGRMIDEPANDKIKRIRVDIRQERRVISRKLRYHR